MNKLLLIGAMATVLLCGCQEKNLDNQVQQFFSSPFVATIENDTKTSMDEYGNIRWKKGDQISIFAGSTINEQYQVSDDSDGQTSAVLNKLSSGFVAGGEMDCNVAFYPYASSVAIARNESAYVINSISLPSTQNYAVNGFGNGAFPMAAVTSTASDYSLKFKNVLGGLKIQLTGTATIKSVSVTGNNNETLCGDVEVTATAGNAPSVNLTDASSTTVTLDCGAGVQLDVETATAFVITLPPMTLTGGFKVVVTDIEDKQMEISTTKSQTIARSTILKMPAVEYVGNTPGPEYVDLGLSVKWATCNLGALKPEEYGGYYQWAGLEDVTSTSIYLDKNYCPYLTGASIYSGWTKYCIKCKLVSGTVDNKTELDLEDDVAHVELGGNWRMPTRAEWEELMNTSNCSWTWTRNYCETGIAGFIITGNKSGYTDKSIFLPSAGRRDGDWLDTGCHYWSSSLYTDAPCYAYGLDALNNSKRLDKSETRYKGLSVRPVYTDVKATSISLDKPQLSLTIGEATQLTANLDPSNCCDKGLTWSSNNSSVATVSSSGMVTAVAAGTAVIAVSWVGDINVKTTCTVTVINPGLESLIDLGLSVKWAACNLGASKPEEYGGYYQWAGLDDVSSTSIYLDSNNCPYHTGSSDSSGWTKYNTQSSYGTVDNKTVLDSEDDVAHVKLGGYWRMPTYEEWTELKNTSNCSWTWTTINGIDGYKVQSKKSGYTDKLIFLPAAGSRRYYAIEDVGSRGYYWSSTLQPDIPYGARGLSIGSDGVFTGFYNCRYFGSSVRPVSE